MTKSCKSLIFILAMLVCSMAFADGTKANCKKPSPTPTPVTPAPTPTPAPAPTPTAPTTLTSGSNSTSGASSVSGSSSVATGGTSNATANGGQGGSATQGQTQSSSNTASASNNGSNVTNTTNVAAPKIPVSTAYAPNAYPTAPCQQGFSAGGQAVAGGISFGGSKTNKVCQMEELARGFILGGSRIAFCKEMVAAAKKADKHTTVTIEDCMYEPPAPQTTVVAAPPAPAPLPAPPVSVQVSTPAAQVVILHETVTVQATRAQVAATKRTVHKKEPCEVITKKACLTAPQEK